MRGRGHGEAEAQQPPSKSTRKGRFYSATRGIHSGVPRARRTKHLQATCVPEPVVASGADRNPHPPPTDGKTSIPFVDRCHRSPRANGRSQESAAVAHATTNPRPRCMFTSPFASPSDPHSASLCGLGSRREDVRPRPCSMGRKSRARTGRVRPSTMCLASAMHAQMMPLNRDAPPRLQRCRSSSSASLHRTRAWRQRDRDR